MDNFRYWLSSKLMDWSIAVLPDEYTKSMIEYGITVACEQMLADVAEREGVTVGHHTIQ